jgi:hypothetical protein
MTRQDANGPRRRELLAAVADCKKLIARWRELAALPNVGGNRNDELRLCARELETALLKVTPRPKVKARRGRPLRDPNFRPKPGKLGSGE